MSKKPEFIDDLDAKTRLAMGITREKTEEEWLVCLEILKMFKTDCQKILGIFDDFSRECRDSSASSKAEYLQREMLDVYPDFLTNPKRQSHIAWLLDKLVKKGHKIISPPNQKYILAYSSFISDDPINDMFALWVADDPDAYYEDMFQKFKLRESCTP